MRSFIEFVRERGVVGLAVGFIFGTAVAQLVTSFINDIVNPLVGLLMGSVQGLKNASFTVAGATVAWGSFVTALLNFVILLAVIYGTFRLLRLDKLDKPK